MKLEDEIAQAKFEDEYQKALINILYTSNWLNGQFSSEFKDQGITQQQYNILRILRGQHPKPASIKLIRERMLDKMSDASRLVEKLRVKGFLKREICEHDRRNVDVLITKEGLTLLERLDEVVEKKKELMHGLTDKEVLKLNELLDKLRG